MEILYYLMKELKKKVDDIVLNFVSNEFYQIKFANNVIVNTSLDENTHLSIFAVKDKKIIATSFKDAILNDNVKNVSSQEKKVSDVVNKLMKFFKMAQPNNGYSGINDKNYLYKGIADCYDKKISNVNGVDLVENGINSTLRNGARRTSGIFETHDIHEHVFTSKGIDYSERKSEFYFSIRGFVAENESGHVNISSCKLSNFNTGKAGKKSGEIATESKNPVNGKKGKYDVIFSPLAFAPVLNSIGESASIFSVESGLSFFTNAMNKKIGSSKISIYDDGRLENGIGSTKADMEGVPT